MLAELTQCFTPGVGNFSARTPPPGWSTFGRVVKFSVDIHNVSRRPARSVNTSFPVVLQDQRGLSLTGIDCVHRGAPAVLSAPPRGWSGPPGHRNRPTARTVIPEERSL